MVSYFFLLIFLVSNTGLSLELHYCKNEITDISFFGNADCVCESEKKVAEIKNNSHTACEEHCHKNSSKVENKQGEIHSEKSCCKTENITYSVPTVKSTVESRLSFEWLAVVAVLNPFFILEQVEKFNSSTVHYTPPLYDKDLLIENSVLLI